MFSCLCIFSYISILALIFMMLLYVDDSFFFPPVDQCFGMFISLNVHNDLSSYPDISCCVGDLFSSRNSRPSRNLHGFVCIILALCLINLIKLAKMRVGQSAFFFKRVSMVLQKDIAFRIISSLRKTFVIVFGKEERPCNQYCGGTRH